MLSWGPLESGRVGNANPVGQALAAGAALGEPKSSDPATPAADSCQMALIQAILAVLHAQMQVHLQTSDANSDN
jgi:hypothetical protein